MATIQRGTGAKFETNDSDGNIGKYPVTSKPRIVYGFYGREWIVGRGRVGALIASNYRNFQLRGNNDSAAIQSAHGNDQAQFESCRVYAARIWCIV